MVKMSEEKIEEIIYRLQKEIVEKFHIKENIKEDIQQDIAVHVLERKENYIKSNTQYPLIKMYTVRFIKSHIEKITSNEISLEECQEIYSIYSESLLARRAIGELSLDAINKYRYITPREKRIVQLKSCEQLTFECIAKEYNVCRSRAEQIYHRGLRRLKHRSARRLLDIYLEMLDEY